MFLMRARHDARAPRCYAQLFMTRVAPRDDVARRKIRMRPAMLHERARVR